MFCERYILKYALKSIVISNNLGSDIANTFWKQLKQQSEFKLIFLVKKHTLYKLKNIYIVKSSLRNIIINICWIWMPTKHIKYDFTHFFQATFICGLKSYSCCISGIFSLTALIEFCAAFLPSVLHSHPMKNVTMSDVVWIKYAESHYRNTLVLQSASRAENSNILLVVLVYTALWVLMLVKTAAQNKAAHTSCLCIS